MTLYSPLFLRNRDMVGKEKLIFYHVSQLTHEISFEMYQELMTTASMFTRSKVNSSEKQETCGYTLSQVKGS